MQLYYGGSENNARCAYLQLQNQWYSRHKNKLLCICIHNISEEKKRNLRSKEKRPQHQNPLLTLSNLHFPPLSSILMNVECNYIYPPVNNLRDTYYTTTKARQYFENIK